VKKKGKKKKGKNKLEKKKKKLNDGIKNRTSNFEDELDLE